MTPNLSAWEDAFFLHRFSERQIIAAILALALLVRLPFFTTHLREQADLDIFVRWARLMQTRELATIYDGTGIDYPPLSLYLFGAAGWIESRLPEALRAGDGALTVLIKLPETLADLLTVWVIARALRGQTPTRRIVACALYALNPAIWYVAAYWAQLDAIYSLFLVVSLVWLVRGRISLAWLAFSIALGIKLQSVALAPLLVVATLRWHGVRALANGLIVSAVAGTIIVAPWLAAGQMGNLFKAVTTVVPRIVDSAYNFWYLMRLGDVHNVSSALRVPLLPIPYKLAGLALFISVVLFVAAFVWRRPATTWALAAALLNMSLFMFLTEIHERYLFPTLAFVLLAEAQNDTRARRTLWLAYALLTLTFLFNLSTVTSFAPALWTNVVAAPPPYSALMAILKALALAAAAVNTLVFLMLMGEWTTATSLRQTVKNRKHTAV